jgi:hypothetical protein
LVQLFVALGESWGPPVKRRGGEEEAKHEKG